MTITEFLSSLRSKDIKLWVAREQLLQRSCDRIAPIRHSSTVEIISHRRQIRGSGRACRESGIHLG